MTNKILNPIEFYNDKKLLTFNLVVLLLGSILCIFMKSWFPAMITMFFRNEINGYKTILENITSIVLLFIILFVAGKIINKKTRVIDCFNLAMFSRIPMYILSTSNIVGTHNKTLATDELSTIDLIILNTTTIINLIVFIYLLVLFYKSFSTITNTKELKHYFVLVVFIVLGLIISPFILKTI